MRIYTVKQKAIIHKTPDALTNHTNHKSQTFLWQHIAEELKKQNSYVFVMEKKGIKCCMKKVRSGFQQIYDSSRWDFSIHLTKAFQQAELSVIVHLSYSYTVGL